MIEKLKIKVSGLKSRLHMSLALIEAGGSDNFRPPASVLQKAENCKPGLTVIEEKYVVLKAPKGVTIYTFLVPVELV